MWHEAHEPLLGRGEEQLLAVRDVALADAPDRAAAGRGERDEQDGRLCEGAAQGYELGWETPRFEIASSREA